MPLIMWIEHLLATVSAVFATSSKAGGNVEINADGLGNTVQ